MTPTHVLHIAVMVLCVVGLVGAIYMWNKSSLAKAGKLDEPSVVQTDRANLIGGVPNAAYGTFFYLALFVASFFFAHRWVLVASLVATALAAMMSVYLAYSLLFKTRQNCPICWTGHAVNWSLTLLLILRLIAIA